MQNQNQVYPTILVEILGQVVKIFWLVVPIIFAIWYFIYALNVRRQVEKIEKQIFVVKKEIDEMLETVHQKRRGYINQAQLEAITKKERMPLRAKLENLKMERQFLLDKISLLNLIKK